MLLGWVGGKVECCEVAEGCVGDEAIGGAEGSCVVVEGGWLGMEVVCEEMFREGVVDDYL